MTPTATATATAAPTATPTVTPTPTTTPTPTQIPGTASVYFEPADVEAGAGDEFTITLIVDPGELGISGGEVDVTYAAGALEVLSHEPGTLIGGDPIVGLNVLDESSGLIQISLARLGATAAPTEPCSFLVVRFRVKQSASAGTYGVSVGSVSLTDEQFQPVSIPQAQIGNATVKVQ